MANSDLVLQESGYPQGPTCSRSGEFGSRQAIQARPDHPSRGLPLMCNRWYQPPVDLCSSTSYLSLHHQETTHAGESFGSAPWWSNLVLGSCSHVQPDPSVPAQTAESAIQRDSTQKSVEPKSPCLSPRTSVFKEQGFSLAVGAQIEAPRSLNQISL